MNNNCNYILIYPATDNHQRHFLQFGLLYRTGFDAVFTELSVARSKNALSTGVPQTATAYLTCKQDVS